MTAIVEEPKSRFAGMEYVPGDADADVAGTVRQLTTRR